MPGACTSSRRSSAELSGPLPSIAWPRPLTTRPMRASPTGTERIRPVALTAPPSSTWLPAPLPRRPVERRRPPSRGAGGGAVAAPPSAPRPPLLGDRHLDEPVDDRRQPAGTARGHDERRQGRTGLQRLPAEDVLDDRHPP